MGFANDYRKNVGNHDWEVRKARQVIYLFADVFPQFSRDNYYKFWMRMVGNLSAYNTVMCVSSYGDRRKKMDYYTGQKFLKISRQVFVKFMNEARSSGIMFLTKAGSIFINPIYAFGGTSKTGRECLWISDACEQYVNDEKKVKYSKRMYNPLVFLDEENMDVDKLYTKTEAYPEGYIDVIDRGEAKKTAIKEYMDNQDPLDILDLDSQSVAGTLGKTTKEENLNTVRQQKQAWMGVKKIQKKHYEKRVKERVIKRNPNKRIQWNRDMIQEIIDEPDDPDVEISYKDSF